MYGIKLFISVYLIYLLIDGILRLLKCALIFAEFGIIITIKGIWDFIKVLFKKLTKSLGVDVRGFDYYMAGGIASIAIDKPINLDIFKPIYKIKTFLIILFKPTILIEYCGRGITIFCAIRKGLKLISSENINSAIVASLGNLGFYSNYYFGPRFARNLPVLANLIHVISYPVCPIIDGFTGKRDIFGASALTKIVRLSIIYLISYYVLFYLVDSMYRSIIVWLQS